MTTIYLCNSLISLLDEICGGEPGNNWQFFFSRNVVLGGGDCFCGERKFVIVWGGGKFTTWGGGGGGGEGPGKKKKH